MEHVRLVADRTLHNPVMLYAFTGWNDAGEAASTAVRTMITHWGAAQLAEIDPEPFTDFATVRPNVLIREGRRQIAWPAVQLFSASLPGADTILMIGPEPALQWRLFSEQVVDVADHFHVSMTISLGALLADVPHTHPVHVIGTASDHELIERFDLRPSSYEGPTGILGVLHDALGAAGTPSASLWATVPGYTAQIPSPKACEALTRTACSMIGTAVPVAAFTNAVAEYEARVAAIVADDEDLASYVSRLEIMMSDHGEDDDDDVDTPGGADITGDVTRIDDDDVEVDSAEFLAEVEQFLRDSGPRSGDDRPPEPEA